MSAPDADTLVYAGIGSRATPEPILKDITSMSSWLSRSGWHLASGGATGAHTAFANGAPPEQRTIYLPWKSYNQLSGADCVVPKDSQLDACMDVAARLHPNWERCKPGTKLLHARNAAILLGTSLDRPVNAVVAWTEGGRIAGGTGMGLRIAAEHGIPVLNLGSITPRKACERLQAMRQTHQQKPLDRTRTPEGPAVARNSKEVRFSQGDIFIQGTQAIVNPVNCVGVMGRGLALEFKKRFPDAFKAYHQACTQDLVRPGRMFVYNTGAAQPRWIVHFPTKRHWRDQSLISDIDAGLRDLAATIERHNIASIAIPPIGAGLGGLDWGDVRALIQQHLADTHARVTVLEPGPLTRSLAPGERTNQAQSAQTGLSGAPAADHGPGRAPTPLDRHAGTSDAPAPAIINLKRNPDAVDNGAIRIDRKTEWGNPFKIGEHGTRDEVIALYQKDLWKRIQSGAVSLTALAELNGKDLACWCAPLPCHGDVLVKAAAWAQARIAPNLRQPVQEASQARQTRAPVYAGVGARRTPSSVLASMRNMARELAARGWHLRTGGAAGADSAFAHAVSAGQRTVFVPWRGYNGWDASANVGVPLCRVLGADEIRTMRNAAAPHHPAWERCPEKVRDLHARNVAVLLGADMGQAVDAMVCWTDRGRVTGGTGMAIRLARHYRIPVLNLAETGPGEAMHRLEGIAASVGASLSHPSERQERALADGSTERRRDGNGEDRSQDTVARSPSPREARSGDRKLSMRL